MDQYQNDYEEISLKEIFNLLKKNIPFLLAFVLAGVILGGLFSAYRAMNSPVEYQYQAAVTMELINRDERSNQPQIVMRVMESPTVLKAATDKLKSKGEYTVTAEASTKKDQYDVLVTGENQADVVKIADEVVAQGMSVVSGGITMGRREIVEKARLVGSPLAVSQGVNVALNLAIATVLGAMLGVFLLFLLRYMSNKVYDAAELESLTGEPVLAELPSHPARTSLTKLFRVR